jgi:subtilisin family serine protease
MLQVPAVWGGTPSFLGNKVKIAVIDTGIDYTHANFGGPGTVAAFEAADAKDTQPADPALFGPKAKTKVKGGYDFVGDDYNADPDDPAYQPVPHPDPNPLDCNGHGSHVAGTAAGYGVLSDGTTYKGPWNSSTISSHSWTIGPGVAPQADLYALRVFGCAGSTDVTVDAIEWAVSHHMDVINMSLGSPFGSDDDPSAVAATNAVRAGVVVVTSSGNEGPSPYMTGSPGTGTGSLSVAASDAIQSTPAATLALSTGQTITAQNSNGFPLSPTTYNVVAISDDPTTPLVNEALGCNVSDYGSLPPNALAVVYRGNCARVAKAIFGQQAGAAAVAMVNNTAGYPPYEGKITSNPDDGVPFEVTIPFFGVRGSSTFPVPPTTDGGKLYAASGGTADASPSALANPNYTGFASFSSAGPRTGDSWLKPDVTAPGVSVTSTLVGSGNQGTIISGTSMASPAVAGIAALVRQAHPSWRASDVKSAIVNTGNPAGVLGYQTSRGGTGLANAPAATKTQVVAIGDRKTGSLSFGFEELRKDYSQRKRIEIDNNGSSPVTFTVSQTNASGSPHTISLGSSSITVGPHRDAKLDVTLSVPVSTVGNADAFREVAGLVTLTPGAGQNNGVVLRVPYYLVPRALSKVDSSLKRSTVKPDSPSTTATVQNRGAIPGSADFYAWGLSDGKDRGKVSNDIRAVGVQSFEWDAETQLLVFGLNVWDRWSNAASNEFDIPVDVDGDGVVDYVVVGVDLGAVTAGDFNGIMGTFVFSTRSPGADIEFLAVAPTDSASLLLPVLSSQLCRVSEPCLSHDNPRFSYGAVGFDLIAGGADEVTGTAKFNAFSSSISQGMFVPDIAPGASSSVDVTIDPTEWALTPARGVMVITFDDSSKSGEEADLLKLDLGK